MDRIILYHGSENIVEKPEYGKGSNTSDYGNAFYCTNDVDAAKEWANKRRAGGYANKYQFDGRGLSVLDLTDRSKYSVLHWVALLMNNRDLDSDFEENYAKELEFLKDNYYIDVTQYDVVIGYRADDSYFLFPLMFVSSDIRLEALEDIYNLGYYLQKQVAIISKKAFGRLKFIEAIKAEPIYYDKYQTRVTLADERFREIAKSERWKDGTKLIDLVKANDK